MSILFSDTIYTERYMGLLSDNMDNYKNASLLTHAEKFRNKKYMVIHGTYDDNVHYQQSMMLSYELERRVILFRQQVSINVGNCYFNELTNFANYNWYNSSINKYVYTKVLLILCSYYTYYNSYIFKYI
jgi:hypothetical protein